MSDHARDEPKDLSTDMSTNVSTTPSPPDAPTKPKIDLSFTQVVGGALAAMTAAFLGSRLSLAGTVVGAALASVVAAVATTLYTASLRTTREKVRTVWRGRGDGTPVAVEPRPGRRVRWSGVLLAALAAFALAAAVLTGLELVSGHSLSGGKGTTITQVAEHKPAGPPTTVPAGKASASPSATTSDSPRPAEPSATVSSEPTPQPSATESAPTATPSATAAPSGDSAATPGTATG